MTKDEFSQLQIGDRVRYSHGGIGTRTIIDVEAYAIFDDVSRHKIGEHTYAITVEGGNRMKEGDFRDLPRLTKVS